MRQRLSSIENLEQATGGRPRRSDARCLGCWSGTGIEGALVNQISLPEETSVTMPSPPSADTRLSGARLLLARGVWIVLMLLFCGFYLAAVLVYYVQFHGFQEGVYAHLISTPAMVSGYDVITSLYLRTVGGVTPTLITPLSPCWFAVSLLIFLRPSDHSMAL